MIIFFQNILFLKEFLTCTGCFGLFTKIKKGSKISLWSTFSAWLFHKNILFLILYQLTKFLCHTFFPSQDIKQNELSSYLGNWWYHKLQNLSSVILSGRQGKNERKTKIRKFECLQNEKSFLDAVRSIFDKYLRAIIWWKNEK